MKRQSKNDSRVKVVIDLDKVRGGLGIEGKMPPIEPPADGTSPGGDGGGSKQATQSAGLKANK